MLKNLYQENRMILKDQLPLRMPLCVSIEPTNLCNFKCVMCFHGNNEYADAARPLKNMEWDVFEKTVDDLKRWTVSEGEKIKLVKLYSLGEPLVNPRLCDMLKVVKDSGIAQKVEITTNGSLLTMETAEKLTDYGLDIIRFSIYAVSDDENKRVTGSDASTEKIWSNVKYLKDYRNRGGGKKPVIYVKMFNAGESENEKFFQKYGDIADEAGLDEIFNIDVGQDRDVFQNFYGENGKDAHQKSLADNVFLAKHPCRYPFTHLTVRNDGTLVSCCADWLKELCFGNIMEHTMKELWESRSLYEIRRKMLLSSGHCFKACSKCEIPYRDLPEDSIEGISIERFGYTNQA